jgi:DNA-directed RNA polymerase specialized sigma24 family protein
VKDNNAGLVRVEAKLDILIRLLALSAVSDNQPLRENAVRLQRAGLTPKEIAILCDTTPNTVSVALSTAKRRGKRGKKATK